MHPRQHSTFILMDLNLVRVPAENSVWDETCVEAFALENLMLFGCMVRWFIDYGFAKEPHMSDEDCEDCKTRGADEGREAAAQKILDMDISKLDGKSASCLIDDVLSELGYRNVGGKAEYIGPA